MLRAPIDGVISRRQVQIRERVQPGQALMVVVPIQGAYVDANFKEVQLAKVRPGQSVTLTSDLYGGEVEYRGRVVGFSGGRSEEHTSELQSLMRSSYAVFCLTKKQNT